MDIYFLQKIRLAELKKIIEILEEQTHGMKGLSLLEIGGGSGWQAKELSTKGYQVESIEIADPYSNYKNSKVWDIKIYDGKHIPFADQSFDIVFSSNVLEHIPHLDSFHKEMQRVLKPEGIAIHVLPSGTWRFWHIFSHYFQVVKLSLGFIQKKISTLSNKESSNSIELPISNKYKELSKFNLIKKAIFPERHGETGNTITELYHFSRYKWEKIFKKGGWKQKKYLPSKLIYTGNSIFGENLSLKQRDWLSNLLGSSCHIFVLEK